jgi:hypothetical protein
MASPVERRIVSMTEQGPEGRPRRQGSPPHPACGKGSASAPARGSLCHKTPVQERGGKPVARSQTGGAYPPWPSLFLASALFLSFGGIFPHPGINFRATEALGKSPASLEGGQRRRRFTLVIPTTIAVPALLTLALSGVYHKPIMQKSMKKVSEIFTNKCSMCYIYIYE